jgi:hypothetical protein
VPESSFVNPVPKRLRLGGRAVDAAGLLVRAIVELREVSFDLAQTGGAFDPADFAGSDIQHVDASLLNQLCSLGIVALGQASASPIDPNDPESPTLDDVMRAVKRA